ncbi:MAG: type II toxin-antitoxin system HicB family antitoxin [Chloroflexi bacterium]|nr:type II toxin-antitoxin system HicB family antitoxin [Chloroflexota bacterium]
MRRYTVFITPDPEEGGYSVRVPALPGCNTQGDTREEAVANAKEAIEGYLETLKALNRPIPEEREHPQAVVIEVAAS